MADWPRKLHGHTVARKVDFKRGGDKNDREDVVHTYLCVKCGLQFAGPDDRRLRDTVCTSRSSHAWQR